MNTILIVRLGALGDIVHALPAAAALRRAFPRARIDWLVDGRHREILDLVPILDRRIVLGGTSGSRESVIGTVAALRREHYDVAIDLQGLIKSAVLARASGAARVVGFDAAHLREPGARFFYTETRDPRSIRSGGHVVDKNLGLVEAIGGAPGSPQFPIELPASAIVSDVRAALGIGPRDAFGVINPGAAWPNKRWPPQRFGGLARAIRERHGFPCAVLWGPGEEALAHEVASHSDDAARLAPHTTIADLVSVMAGAALVVSGDTGPMHVAAAVGAPIVGLFGPTDPVRNGPWSPHDRTVSRFQACACHHRRRCHSNRWCLQDVSVEEVLAAVDRRLASAPSHV